MKLKFVKLNSFLFLILFVLFSCSKDPETIIETVEVVKEVEVTVTETVEVEIYAPPLPPEIQLNDVEWIVITNTPCKPATGKKTLSEGKWYYTTERFEYEEYFDEEKQETRRRVKRDAEGNRIELPHLEDGNGVIQVCGNLQQKIAEVELMLDGDFVIFAITPVGYEKMSANLQEIKRYINQQKDIIYYYREATAPKGVDGWLEENKERQEQQVEKAAADYEQVSDEPEVEEKSGFSLNSLIPSIGKTKD